MAIFENIRNDNELSNNKNKVNQDSNKSAKFPISIYKMGPGSIRVHSDIHYTIVIENFELTDMENVIFHDKIPNGYQYAEGTFHVNNQRATPQIEDNTIKYTFERIPLGTVTDITFLIRPIL